ncbi:hypothetical protein FIV42_08450 [Persicimonas caeni]|uniref:Uncharacterized protein n=1 Tax=Persicimonas caeni TaxID=2292766 RepID=A0A4Y6PRM0_PERCE|nr:hypothetical protein [Persicimonas caeni]QDG50759.1 hypothetical protein FIV42_08450 [Persicimonas caeni]QED31980.1 hypothetical protein FRD00_08445 [Persicimonas caeni]
MSTRAIRISLIAALSLFFLSGCGIFKQQSKRYISTTHWGEMGGGAFAEKEQPAPEPEAKSDVEAAAEESAGTKTEEGNEASAEGDNAPEAPPQEVASAGNVGSTAQSSGGDEDMTLYIAYYEHITTENMLNGETNTAAIRSHLRICQLQEDNSLQCSENKELNKMLNPHMQPR